MSRTLRPCCADLSRLKFCPDAAAIASFEVAAVEVAPVASSVLSVLYNMLWLFSHEPVQPCLHEMPGNSAQTVRNNQTLDPQS